MLVNQHPNFPMLKLADFGMVKNLSETPKDNYNVGTPIYMPPESLLQNIYTEKTDVWALGIIIYQIIHGALPWRGRNEQELKAEIQAAKVVCDPSLASPGLIHLIGRCLERDVNNRASIKELEQMEWVQAMRKQDLSSHSHRILNNDRNLAENPQRHSPSPLSVNK